ncbi:hypothetical protein Ciccas_000455 [Cichlidogyrus casuarinus]|uniref:Uncharacterized protein n=1 Tax=Cichlidogyrus casuarinus TaxID=1844966 RepID=A0ABD2QMU4_9PLAT
MFSEPLKRRKFQVESEPFTNGADSLETFDSLDEEAFTRFIDYNRFDPSKFLNDNYSDNQSSDNSLLSASQQVAPIDGLFSSLFNCTNHWLDSIQSRILSLPTFATSQFTRKKLHSELRENEPRRFELNSAFLNLRAFPELVSKYESEVLCLNERWDKVLISVSPLDALQFSGEMIACEFLLHLRLTSSWLRNAAWWFH